MSLFFLQVCLAAAAFMPKVPLVNFIKALNANPNSSVNVEVSTGHDCTGASININVMY